MDPNFIQKRMQEIQQNDAIANAFGKLVSGKEGYKAVIEKKQVFLKCKNCSVILDHV